MTAEAPVIDATKRWLASVVIGLNLCPFARRVFEAERIRYVVSEATTEKILLADLSAELASLAASPISQTETTLLIHPHVLADFLDYNDFLDAAEQELERLDLDGILQIASFHPQYQFAGTTPDDVENYTNRSPFPMLHLLREESISSLTVDEAELAAIPERNMQTMRELGPAAMKRMWRDARSDG